MNKEGFDPDMLAVELQILFEELMEDVHKKFGM